MLMRLLFLSALCGVFGCDRDADHGSDMPAAASEDDSHKPADNTARNERDRSGDSPTPLDQGNGALDTKITGDIREAIVARDDLSFDAKNIKVITSAGHVTLRGPVASNAERNQVCEIARRIAGADRVDDQLEVTTNN